MNRFTALVLATTIAAVAISADGQSTARPTIVMDRHSAVPARWALDEEVPDINVDSIPVSRVIDFLRLQRGENVGLLKGRTSFLKACESGANRMKQAQRRERARRRNVR